jgi:hypothetical protein
VWLSVQTSLIILPVYISLTLALPFKWLKNPFGIIKWIFIRILNYYVKKNSIWSPNFSLPSHPTIHHFSSIIIIALPFLISLFLNSLCFCCHYKWYLFSFGFLTEFININPDFWLLLNIHHLAVLCPHFIMATELSTFRRSHTCQFTTDELTHSTDSYL